MDRRRRRTREMIFHAFTTLLTRKNYNQITVGQIIEFADIGRATFYSHFETKDILLKDFCAELFAHIFNSDNKGSNIYANCFDCSSSSPILLHLFEHIQRNDNNILTLLSSPNNDLFLRYFRINIEQLFDKYFYLFDSKIHKNVPLNFSKNHIISTFMGTLQWWIDNSVKEAPDVITAYFFEVV